MERKHRKIRKNPEKIRLKTKTVSSVIVSLPLFYRSFSDEPAGLARHTSASLPYFPYSEENLIRINGTSFYACEMYFLSVTHAIVSKQLPCKHCRGFVLHVRLQTGAEQWWFHAGAEGGGHKPRQIVVSPPHI